MLIVILSITLINLLLSIDNIIPLVLIVEPLSSPQLRRTALLIGILGGAVLRIIFAAIAEKLFSYGAIVYAISGVFLLYIGIQGLRANKKEATQQRHGASLMSIILSIIVIDVSLSIDNIAGIIAITQNTTLLLIGIFISALLLFGVSFGISAILSRVKGLDIAAYIAILFLAMKLFLWAGGIEISSYITSGIIIAICVITVVIVSLRHKLSAKSIP